MTNVELRAVKLEDAAKFFENGRPGCFNAKDIKDFDAAVRVCALEVDAVDTHDGLEIRAICLQDPLALRTRLDRAFLIDRYLVVLDEESALNARDPTQTDILEHRIFELTQENIFLNRAQTVVLFVGTTQHSAT